LIVTTRAALGAVGDEPITALAVSTRRGAAATGAGDGFAVLVGAAGAVGSSEAPVESGKRIALGPPSLRTTVALIVMVVERACSVRVCVSAEIAPKTTSAATSEAPVHRMERS